MNLRFNKNTILIVVISLLIGSAIGYFISTSGDHDIAQSDSETIATDDQIWTCSMHPQIRQNEPGDCPICGMDLIPLEEDDATDTDPTAVRMSPTAMQLADVRTTTVGSSNQQKNIRLTGKVQVDERQKFTQSAHIPGRIEQLTVNFTGELVSEGQTIARIYSPQLLTAQEELFEAQKIREAQPALFESAKAKLKNWKLSETQINEILQSGEAQSQFPVLANASGYVTELMVQLGDYVQSGEPLFEISDLSQVWVLFDLYESEMGLAERGDTIRYTVQSIPGKSFTGTIDYIDPVIDATARVARARIVADNPNLQLKPEMFVSGRLESDASFSDAAVVVPKSAVMWTGERSVVYVKQNTEAGVFFNMREVTLGPAMGDSYVIEDGLNTGEEIAVNGTFSIDAAAQLAGKPSMMNRGGGETTTEHDHGPERVSGQPYEQHREKTTHSSEKITEILTGYLEIKDALVETNGLKASQTAEHLLSVLGDANDALTESIRTSTRSINANTDPEEQREHFEALSEDIYTLAKSDESSFETLYRQYCPMAFNNEGAYWLSAQKEIRNPYFGDRMLKCGSVEEVID